MKKLFSLLSIVAILVLFNQPIFYAQAAGSPVFDATATNAANPSTALTIAHTNAGSGECDVLFSMGGVTDTETSATDNGITMTLLDKSVATGRWVYTYFLQPAPSGTTNIVINATGSDLLQGAVFSYSNCGGVDVHNHTVSTTSVSTFVNTITTTKANDTVLSWGENSSVVTDNWGGTNRYIDNVVVNGKYDDKAIAAASSVTFNWSGTANNAWLNASVALCPTGGCVATTFIFNFWHAF